MISSKDLLKLFGKDGKHMLLISNISWQGIEKGTRMLAGVYTGILLASYLGPESLGIYSYALSFVSLFAPIIDLGYDGYLARDIIIQSEKWRDILGTSAFLRFAGSILSIALIWIIAGWDHSLNPETKQLIWILSLSFLLYPFDVFDIWFKTNLKSSVASLSKIVALVAINILKILFIYQKAALTWFAWLYVAEFIVNGILQLIFYLRLEPQKIRKWKVSGERIKFVVKESWPLLVSGFSFLIYNRIDQIMIGKMIGEKEVGIFSAAGKISDLPLIIILVINAAIFPVQAEYFKTDLLLFKKQYRLITEIYTFLALVMTGFVFLFSGWIMHIYPSAFAAGETVLQINFIGMIFIFNAGLRNSYLSLTGGQRFLLYSTVISAAINIGLNIFLIPAYGINGAAWASTITEFAALFLLNGAFTKTHFLIKTQAVSFAPVLLFKKKSL